MKKKSFTLIEMVIVIMIIALLAAVVAPMYMKHMFKARIDAAKAQIKNLDAAVMDYQLSTGRVPTESETLDILIRNVNNDKRWDGPYLKTNKIPVDPWGNEYVYKVPGTYSEYAIISLGADGKEGGTGNDADISGEYLSGENETEEEN